ncbi:hypothetical protein CSUI_007633 [Cystoisospora suis]|uniref:Uncharacterized protein n=1 Tax=Cystoisospora suis TaxID=483139 RepID=A0A2C6KQ83_9APIC|nr:hypothetical protein CSUI_007633 [Cystoisospora suis]
MRLLRRGDTIATIMVAYSGLDDIPANNRLNGLSHQCLRGDANSLSKESSCEDRRRTSDDCRPETVI